VTSRAGSQPGRDQRRGETTKRLSHHDQIAAAQAPRRAGHGIGVLSEPGRVVLARQVGRGRLVSPGAQLPFHQVPVPSHVSGAMDQHKHGHLITSLTAATPSAPSTGAQPRHARGSGSSRIPASSL